MVLKKIKISDLQYGNNTLSPEDMEGVNLLLEQILDKIADTLINSQFVDPEIVSQNQKTIREGIISLGRENSDILVLYQKDIKANEEDLINRLDYGPNLGHQQGLTLKDIITIFYTEDYTIEQINIVVRSSIDNDIHISLFGGIHSYDITSLLLDGENNPLNVSQFININQEGFLNYYTE